MDAPADLLYVDTPGALDTLYAGLAGQPWLALDTEFIREDTYYARLCLVQVAVPGITACVDTIALPHLDPLLERLHDPAVTKILHACHQDLEIFFHLCDGRVPAPVFDTQLAAALLGLPPQASYAQLVSELLGITLEKGHARTDWLGRPLSAAQIAYAADDVRWLGPLHVALRERLDALGRLAWLVEDCTAASDPARYANPPGEAWQRVRAARHLDTAQQRRLRALAAWRELAARNANRPRGWLLRDDALVDIARAAPRDQAALEAIPSVPRKAAVRYGERLLAILDEDAGANGPGVAPVAPGGGRLDERHKTLLKRMTGVVRRTAEDLGIDPAALASRRDLLALLDGSGTSPVLRGWRRGVVGDALLALAPDMPATAAIPG